MLFPPLGDLSDPGIKPKSPRVLHCRQVLFITDSLGKPDPDLWGLLNTDSGSLPISDDPNYHSSCGYMIYSESTQM